jgi:putative ABC transport system permease protein
MINRETILYSLRNLEQRKGRSLFTIFSILLGIAAIFIFISFGIGLQTYVSEITSQTSADKISIMAKGSGVPGLEGAFALTDEDLEAIEDANGVKEVVGLYTAPVEVTQNGHIIYTFLISYDSSSDIVLELFGDLGAYKGRLLRPGDKKIVLGFNYLVEDKIFPQAYDLNDKIIVDGKDLTIVGFFESVGSPQDDAQMYVTNDFFEELYPEEVEGGYGWVVARVENIENLDNTIEDIEDNLRESRGLEEGKEDFFVQSYQELIESFASILDIVVGFIILIALVSVLVSGINTANTMITTVLERTKEVGIIKSVGAKNSEVLGIFLFESAVLGFVAGVAGCVVGWLFSSAAGAVLNNLGWGFLSPAFPAGLWVGCILFATITGGLSGIMPAINASKIKPVDALRYE